jgi:hypothetical protein
MEECLGTEKVEVKIEIKLDENLEYVKRVGLEEAVKAINAKAVMGLRRVQNVGNSVDMLAVCVLVLFEQTVPKGFYWENVAALCMNPGVIIGFVRKSVEIVKNKQLLESNVREIFQKLETVDKNEIESHKLGKELRIFYDYLDRLCSFYIYLWPSTMNEVEGPKRKFRIPASVKNVQENEMLQQINKEKRLLQELKYQERKLKWEEERNIKKEMKQELIREMQREINYSKSIEDEFRAKQDEAKKIEKMKKISKQKQLK